MSHFLGYQIALRGVILGVYLAQARDRGNYGGEIVRLGPEQLLTKLDLRIRVKHIEQLALEIGNRLYGIRARQAVGREFNTAEVGIYSG
jgi:hypothetical protein